MSNMLPFQVETWRRMSIIVIARKTEEQKPTKVYGHEDYYVGRALDGLTVTTRMLCRDSAYVELAGKPPKGGFPFIYAPF